MHTAWRCQGWHKTRRGPEATWEQPLLLHEQPLLLHEPPQARARRPTPVVPSSTSNTSLGCLASTLPMLFLQAASSSMRP